MLNLQGNKLPGKEIILEFPVPIQNSSEEFKNLKIPLFVDMNAGIGGDIWPAATLFGNILTHSNEVYNIFSKLCREKRLIELGSGNGLVSILMEKLFPNIQSIAVSDIDDHLPLMDHNLKLNNCNKCYVESVNWLDYSSRSVADSQRKTYQVVLALEW